MSTTPILYTSLDDSAPTLNGEAGSLVALLEACLVNGYGSKAAAGWEVVKSPNGEHAAFRSATATGPRPWFYVNDSAATYAEVRGYLGFTSVDDTGALAGATDPFPLLADAPANKYCAMKSNTAGTSTRYWRLVATHKAFYFLPFWHSTYAPAGGGGAATTDSQMPETVAFGEYVSLHGISPAPVFIHASRGTSTSYPGANGGDFVAVEPGATPSMTGTDSKLFVGPDQAGTPRLATIRHGSSTIDAPGGYGAQNYYSWVNDYTGAPSVLRPLVFVNRERYYTFPVGYLPGLYAPLGRPNNGNPGSNQDLDVVTTAGPAGVDLQLHKVCRWSQGGFILLDMEGDWHG